MKIISLHTENIKRLSAVDITPEGHVVTIGGKNGAGKSSVLDSIAYALGGADLIPSEPIKHGETDAVVSVNLGDYIVKRKFRRERLACDCTAEPGQEHAPACGSLHFGPTRSTLVVENADGAKYPSPQALLDKLIGQLTFDPLAFAHADKKSQAATLRAVAGIDTTQIERDRAELATVRTTLGREVKALEARVDAMPSYAGVPDDEVPVSAISDAMLAAEHARAHARAARQTADRAAQAEDTVRAAIGRWNDKIAALEAELTNANAARAAKAAELPAIVAEHTVADAAAEAAEQAVPDVDAIRGQITDIEATNQKVRANASRARLVAELDALRVKHAATQENITVLDMAKELAVSQAAFPVEGLGIDDAGVTLRGVPFDQASTAEQIAVSVAIGLALNPKLRVILVRNGNLMDSDTMKAIATQAEKADAQLWVEYMTETKGGVSVFIEEGAAV